MTNSSLRAHLLLSSVIVFLVTSGCSSNVIDTDEFHRPISPEFNINQSESIKYQFNVVIGHKYKDFALSYNKCSDDLLLITNEYLYLLENPENNSKLEYQLNIYDCGTSVLRPKKAWKINLKGINHIARYFNYYQIKYLDREINKYLYIGFNKSDVKSADKSFEKYVGIKAQDNVWSRYRFEEDRPSNLSGWDICSYLVNSWNERRPILGGLWTKRVQHPAFWKKIECLSKKGLWSKDREVAQNLYDANDREVLYTGGTDKGNNCGPYSSSWVSTESYLVNVCDGKWVEMSETPPATCDGENYLKLRRLVIGNEGCYVYGEHEEAFINRFDSWRY